MYARIEKKDLIGYIDSDFAHNLDNTKNSFGYVFHPCSGVISWAYKKHSIVTLFLAEAGYVVATSTTCQAMWLRTILDGLKQKQQGSTTIYYENTSSIAPSKNSVFH